MATKWNTSLSEKEQERLGALHGKTVKYLCPAYISYYSTRYKKFVKVDVGYPSDGATGTFDLNTIAWWVHDVLCDRGTWEDGTKVSNLQASFVLYDILMSDGHWFYARRWFVMTLAFGGGEARKNGVWRVTKT